MAHMITSLFSNPVDAHTKHEIEKIIKSVLLTFTTLYVKKYAIALVKKIMDESQQEPEPTWKLLERPPRTDSFMEGYVIKEAGFFSRTMEKRYFVVRPDHVIDYYVTEEDYKAGKKPKNNISLCGYSVNDDANNGPYQRMIHLAEKMGIDTSALPKPKEYPANTMELYHSRRECYYVHVEDKDEFKKWLDQMRTCARRAYGYKNKDSVHIKAFEAAIRGTRSKLGRWGWWSWGGTEEQILSDLISDEIEWTVMGGVYSKINSGPWIVRSTIQEKVRKFVDKIVIAAVTPAWKAMDNTVQTLRPKLEPKVKETVGPIGEAKLKMMTKIKDACMSVIDPALKKSVIPHISKIVAAIESPMVESFHESHHLFEDEVIGKFEAKESVDENKKEFKHLDHFPWSWKFWDVTRKVDVMYDPLWALHEVFSDISPWSLVYDAHDLLRTKMDNAIYTFEERFIEDTKEEKHHKEAVAKVREDVIKDYKADARQAITMYHQDIIKKIVMPVLQTVVIPAADAILSPIADAIPEAMQDFLDIDDMFQRILEGVVDDTIKSALEGGKGEK